MQQSTVRDWRGAAGLLGAQYDRSITLLLLHLLLYSASLNAERLRERLARIHDLLETRVLQESFKVELMRLDFAQDFFLMFEQLLLARMHEVKAILAAKQAARKL